MFDRWMKSVAGAAVACLIVVPGLAAPVGKPVETQTIIVPDQGDDESAAAVQHAMPQIPSESGAGESPAGPGVATPEEPPAASPPAATDNLPPKELPAVEYDVSKLPEPVKQLREKILAAAATG